MKHRNTLRPIRVPWRVSPSVPDVHFTVVENGDSIAVFDVSTVAGEGDAASFVDGRVELRFRFGQWARVEPAATDSDPIPEGLFDWTAVRPETDDVFAQHKASRREWLATGYCPDPGVYQVEDSRWLHESGAVRFVTSHYVLSAHDMWLEVLCDSISWRFVEGVSSNAIEIPDELFAGGVGGKKDDGEPS